MFFPDDVVQMATSLNETLAGRKLASRDPLRLNWAKRTESVGRHAIRYGLVLVLLWIGGMKFTAYEATGASAFVANSPLMNWAYSLFSIQDFSALVGVAEIVTALLIAGSTALDSRCPGRQRLGRRHVLDHLELSVYDPGGLGGIGGRIPRAIRGPRAIPYQRRGIARRFFLDVRRGLAEPISQPVSSAIGRNGSKQRTVFNAGPCIAQA